MKENIHSQAKPASSSTDNTPTVRFITIDSVREGQRIDNFLLRELKGLPKSHLYRIVRKGEVRVNKKRIKPDYKLQIDDVVRIPPVRLGQAAPIAVPSQSLQTLLKDRILYEDEELLILNKPAGIAVHGGSGINLGVIETLRAMQPKERFLELVHRLDRETSGCLLLAKKPKTLKELHLMLKEGQVDKRYLTLVKGHWPKYLHFVDAALQKFELRSGERMVNVSESGKACLTEYKLVQRFADVTLMQALPKTGRTHQIRVHATHVGHPIIGDEKYGDKEMNKKFRDLGCKRLFLHASSLTFKLSSGQVIEVKAPLDQDLQALLDKLT